MKFKLKGTVFIVDDDASVRKGLARFVNSAGLDAITFSSAREFLETKIPETSCCLILDLQMPGLSGLDLQDEMRLRKIDLPVIFLTGHGNIHTSVRAMKSGATDFLEKPFDGNALLEIMQRALDKHEKIRDRNANIEKIRLLLETLTPREKQVLEFVITGMLNKQIADKMGISEKTVKIHRDRVMKKMNVVSVADLVRLVQNS
jgi:RNA polymerase sigma factor (sigma-70 family)